MSRPTIAARRLRLTLEAPTAVPDDIGGTAPGWQAVGVLWTRIQSQGGAEVVEAQRLEGRVQHRLAMRWRGDVTPAMRLSGGGRIYAIIAAYDPDGRQRDLICQVEEVQP